MKTKPSSSSLLLTAPQVARHCSADLKTIHNWVNAGQIRSFRTPGRHLRFRPEDVVEFLERFGYPVPTELQHFVRHVVVIIEPDDDVRDKLRKDLARRHEVRSYECPVEALLSMGRDQPDLIVSEVQLPGVDGYRMVERLSAADELGASGRLVVVYSSEGDEAECERAGAAALVQKPDFAGLKRRVGQLLDQRSIAN